MSIVRWEPFGEIDTNAAVASGWLAAGPACDVDSPPSNFNPVYKIGRSHKDGSRRAKSCYRLAPSRKAS